MMYQTVNFSMFRDAFVAMGRDDQFSHYGLEALYDYLTDFGSDQEPVELDVIALCCEFVEYPSAVDAVCDMQPGMVADFEQELKSGDESPAELYDVIKDACLEWLQNNTMVIQFDGGIIIHNF